MGFSHALGVAVSLSAEERVRLVQRLLALDGGETAGVDAHDAGFVVYPEGADTTQQCSSFMLLPGMNLVDYRILACAYFLGMCYVFLGIAIISDLFMGAIEVITSKEAKLHTSTKDGSVAEYTYKVWNASVANLTLMALGSSAPEIMLAIVGTLQTLDAEPDELGPSTIVGSAAFNLLMISAICVVAIPPTELRRIEDLGVFVITAVTSILAYVWLYVALSVSSPNVVELWEALVTFAAFPALVLVAYGQDVNWKCFRRGGGGAEGAEGGGAGAAPAPNASPHRTSSYRSSNLRASRSGGSTPLGASPPGTPHLASPEAELRFTAKGDRRARISTPGARAPRVTAMNVRRDLELVDADDSDSDGAQSVATAAHSELNHPHAAGHGAGGGGARGRVPRSSVRAGEKEMERLMASIAQVKDFDEHKSAPMAALPPTAALAKPSAGHSKASYRTEAIRGLIGKRRLSSAGNLAAKGLERKPTADGAGEGGAPLVGSGTHSAANSRRSSINREDEDGLHSPQQQQQQQHAPPPSRGGGGGSGGKAAAPAAADGRAGRKSAMKVVQPAAPDADLDANGRAGGQWPAISADATTPTLSPATSAERRRQLAMVPLSERQTEKNALIVDAASVVLEFSHKSYPCSAAWGRATLAVRRVGNTDTQVLLSWRTVEAPGAPPPVHYEPARGVLEFGAGVSTLYVHVPLAQGADGASAEYRRSFEVALDEALGVGARLGKRSRALVHLVGTAEPTQPSRGMLRFSLTEVSCIESVGSLRLHVERVGGYDGALEVSYRTEDGTAKAGVDYQGVEAGTLTFGPYEKGKDIEIKIIDDDIEEDDTVFVVELLSADTDAIAGSAARCTVTIIDDDSWNERMSRFVKSVRAEMAKSLYTTESWSEQIKEAVVLSGGVDDETGEDIEPTAFDSVMHSLSLFWKLLFALVPPTSYLGGWAAFVVSLFFIGVCTTVVGEFAKLFGCVLGLSDAVTAITFVALGTSLPDTLASRTAAMQDDTADAAVGNVTGSNSVNVFLGLGLPWLIGSVYHNYMPGGKGQYEVPATGLAFSVAVFTGCAILALGLLMLRRVVVGGELGGNLAIARATSAFLAVLWLAYIVLASMQVMGRLPGVAL